MRILPWLFVWSSLAFSCTNSTETQIPVFRAKLFKGDTVELQAIARNKVTLISMWSIFCAPCLKELPRIQALHEHYKGNPQVAFITLAMNNEEELERFTSPAKQASLYRKAFIHSEITRLTLPVLIGTRSAYKIEPEFDAARFTDTAAATRIERLFRSNAVPMTWIYNREGKLVFEQRGIESSAAALNSYQLNLSRKIDSLVAL